MAETLTHLYLTELLGLVVYDTKGRRIGRIRDAALVPVIDPARVDRFLVGGGWSWLTVRWDQVQSVGLDGIRLKDEVLTPYHADEYMLRLVRDLLDQQIIDAQGRKVVRVTDVTFNVRDGRELRVMEVDVGMRSVFRRLVQGLLPRAWIRRLQQRIPVSSIPWEFTNILEPDPHRRLRLNIKTNLLEKLHPADLADIVEELGPEDREAIFEAMEPEKAAEALSEVDLEIQASILESLETGKAVEILEEMTPADAAAAIAELNEETSAEILEEMEGEPQEEVRELLEFADDTAGGMMDTEMLVLVPDATVEDARAAMRASEDLIEHLNTVFVSGPGGTLSGSIPLARLLAAPPDAVLSTLATSPVIQVPVTAREEEITELFDKYNLLSLPVVDQEGKPEGVIKVDDVITVLRRR
jgi:flagellar motility protein MotE (MotC chaperone)/sporulation protein YlmC with PRC-barrel domain